MASPKPVEPAAPAKWWAPLVGFAFAALVVTALGLATAASYDNERVDKYDKTESSDEKYDDEHGDDHSEDDHSDE